jgi:trans-2,3-dihydro-3-hydroxyanthranilate isomerase
MNIRYFILDAFTDTPFQGNPAGVFFDDEAVLTAEQMRQLAGEVSLESAFVTPVNHPDADYKLRYFTGVTEVPFCGHDTLSTAIALVRTGREPGNQILRFATPVGILPVGVQQSSGGAIQATLFQKAPEFTAPLSQKATEAVIAALVRNQPERLDARAGTSLPIQVVSTGTPWLLVPVEGKRFAGRYYVNHAPADFDAIAQLSTEHNTYGIYLFAVEKDEAGKVLIRSRCFAPIAGLNEDPVTGSASGALGCYLAEHGVVEPGDGVVEITAQQGSVEGRHGTAQIAVRRENGVWRTNVMGTAVLVAEGTFTLP